MNILTILATVSALEWVLGVVATVASALLIGVGKLVWNLTGEVREMGQELQTLSKKVDRLERLIDQGRKWRWDKTPLPQPDDE